MDENIAHPKRIEYYGQTKDDLFHGFGKAFYRSGELYIGNWYKGKRHGKGTLFFRKGDRYTGYWKNDQMDGDGTMITGPGIKYKGNFKNNRKHGEATITYINGKTFYEKWEDGVLIYHQSHDPKDDVESEIDIEETKEIINKKLNSNSFKIKPRREENDEKYKQQKHHIVEDKLENVEEKLNVPVVRPTNQNTSNKTIVNTKLNDDSVVINNLSKIVQESKNIQECVNFNDLKKCLNNNDMNGMVLVGIKKEDLIKYFQDKSPAKETNNIQKEIQEMDMGSIVDITKKKIIQDIINNDNKDITTFTAIEPKDNIEESKFMNEESLFGNSLLKSCQKNHSMMRSKSVVLLIKNCDQTQLTAQKSRQLKISDRVNESIANSTFNSGFNLMIDFVDLYFSQKNDLIATGGYGEVYKGKWLGLSVAIKKFNKKYGNNKAYKELIKEIEVLHSLRHPYIVQFLGVSFDKHNQCYMVTEYVNKGSLFHILHKKNVILNESKAFTIAKQIAIAMNFLHQHGIHHCDLKSQNILIRDDWSIKICDFGLSKIGGLDFCEKQGRIGTPHWMAPEILRGEKYEGASDVYSYGVILWELITGQIPYLNRSLAQITGLVGYYGQRLPIPKTKSCPSGVLQKLTKNCLLFESNRRPTFEHIISYLEKYEFKIYSRNYDELLESTADFLS